MDFKAAFILMYSCSILAWCWWGTPAGQQNLFKLNGFKKKEKKDFGITYLTQHMVHDPESQIAEYDN